MQTAGLPRMKNSRPDRGAEPRPAAPNQPGFVHSVLGFTRLEIPEVELFETAVTFVDPETDPVAAHDALADVFGQKAGYGQFLFHKDSVVPGRYWVQSVEPWNRWPERAANALEPKRIVVQLAEGLMYRFTLPVCAGRETIDGKEKRVVAFETVPEVEKWFKDNAAIFVSSAREELQCGAGADFTLPCRRARNFLAVRLRQPARTSRRRLMRVGKLQ